MMTFFEKRLSSKSTFRVISSVLYALSIFLLPLSHTCLSIRSERSYCHLKVSEFQGEVEAGCRDQEGSGHDNHNGKPSSRGDSCAACIHSVNSKTSTISVGIILISYESSIFSCPALISQRPRHTEWTTSVFLRGPPLNIS